MIIYQWESKQHGYINPYEKWTLLTITQHGQLTKLTRLRHKNSVQELQVVGKRP